MSHWKVGDKTNLKRFEKSGGKSKKRKMRRNRKRKGGNGDCPICLEELKEDEETIGIVSECGHEFHHKCIKYWTEDLQNKNCPLCRGVCNNIKTKEELENIQKMIDEIKLFEKTKGITHENYHSHQNAIRNAWTKILNKYGIFENPIKHPTWEGFVIWPNTPPNSPRGGRRKTRRRKTRRRKTRRKRRKSRRRKGGNVCKKYEEEECKKQQEKGCKWTRKQVGRFTVSKCDQIDIKKSKKSEIKKIDKRLPKYRKFIKGTLPRASANVKGQLSDLPSAKFKKKTEAIAKEWDDLGKSPKSFDIKDYVLL